MLDTTELLLKVALNTINPNPIFTANEITGFSLKRKGIFSTNIKVIEGNEWMVMTRGLSTINAIWTSQIVSVIICSIHFNRTSLVILCCYV